MLSLIVLTDIEHRLYQEEHQFESYANYKRRLVAGQPVICEAGCENFLTSIDTQQLTVYDPQGEQDLYILIEQLKWKNYGDEVFVYARGELLDTMLQKNLVDRIHLTQSSQADAQGRALEAHYFTDQYKELARTIEYSHTTTSFQHIIYYRRRANEQKDYRDTQ